jgi:hypothetical protein
MKRIYRDDYAPVPAELVVAVVIATRFFNRNCDGVSNKYILSCACTRAALTCRQACPGQLELLVAG